MTGGNCYFYVKVHTQLFDDVRYKRIYWKLKAKVVSILPPPLKKIIKKKTKRFQYVHVATQKCSILCGNVSKLSLKYILISFFV